MAQHISEPTALFPHLESSDLHTVQEFKVLIQDNLSSARDPSFLHALVDFYLQRNSFQAQDILAGVREPLDKPLLDKLNECLKSSSSRLPALTLLSHIVRRQPSWLYKIVQTPLFASLITCLKTDTDIPVLMCGVLMVTILLPMIPSQVGPFLHDICEIFARLATWNVHKPGDVHDVHQLHLQAGVYALFHRLYGMYPWNFLEFLQAHFANKEKEFNCAILPMLERVRMHPRLITGQKSKETDLTRWRKMEVHDILMECARVSLDTTESTCDDHSTNSLSLSESRQGATSHTATRSNVSSACKVASPVTTSDSLPSSDTKHASSTKQQTPTSLPKKPDPTSSLISSQAILSMMWSPAVDCGLTTPPSSHPPSPGGSLMDLSTTSSLQMGYGDPSSSLTTPRDSPHSALGEDQTQRLFNISEGHTPSKAVRKAVRKGPSALPRHQNILQRTTSAPSTPGYEANGAWLPTSPIRKGSVDRSVFNFGGRASFMRQACKPGENQNSNRESTVRSLHSSGRGPGPGLEERVLEDSVEETNEQKVKCHKAQQEDSSDEHGTSVSLKDLPNVIKDLSAEHRDHREQEDANNAEVFSIVSSPQHNEEFMSKVIAGLNQHKGESKESTHYISTALNGTPNYSFVMNSTPKFEVGRSFGPSGHEMAEEKDSNDLPAEHSDSLCDSEKPGEGQSTDKSSGQAGECQSNAEQNSISEGPHHSPGEGQKISQKLFHEECAGNTSSERPGERPVYATGEATEETELAHKEPHETPHRQSSINQGFTPIRDCSVDSIESPYTFTSSAHTSAHQAFMAFSHLFPLVTPSYLYTSHSDMNTSVSRSKGDHVTSSEVQSVTNPLHMVFSPTEILDRHIAMSDEVHDKELSRLPLTSQKSVNWTHYGGSPPADEINVLKGQLQLLHNQLLYERHKREVHAGRNRRLLGKTHKAKALEELNTAMKDQLRLQEEEILRLSTLVKQLQLEKRQFSNDCSLKDQKLRDDIQKLESDKVHLMECNEELNKLLVSHKQEVDKMKKDLQTSNASLLDMEQELASTKADIATNKHLKDEIARLNREILLLGEAITKYKERIEESKVNQAVLQQEEEKQAHYKKELTDCHDAVKHKTIQLEAAKARIIELDALLSQRDRSIAEQKRYLESVKNLSHGKVDALEAKYHSLKKVNQRQEAHILQLTKCISECRKSQSHGGQIEDSSASSRLSRSNSSSPRKQLDRQDSTDSRGSRSRKKAHGNNLSEYQTPVGSESWSSSVHPKSFPNPTETNGEKPQSAGETYSKGLHSHLWDSSHEGNGNNSDSRPQTDVNPNTTKGHGASGPSIKFSETSPFEPVQSMSSAPTHLGQNKSLPDSFKTLTSSCPEFDHFSQNSECRSEGAASQSSSVNRTISREDKTNGDNILRPRAVVDNVGSGIDSHGIASLLDLDTSIEEHGLGHW